MLIGALKVYRTRETSHGIDPSPAFVGGIVMIDELLFKLRVEREKQLRLEKEKLNKKLSQD